ncbi:MAG: LCP family protein [Candidatus Desulforudis sp.]|nr:LCP family protein [Desulforudis sp.]
MALNRRQFRLKNARALVIGLTILALTVFGGYAGAKYMLNYLFGDPVSRDPDGGEDIVLTERMNLVLLGVDAQAGDDPDRARADSILFVSADPQEQRVVLLSIPRDTRVNIPRHGWDKINATTVYGGPDAVREAVSELLGVPVDYYVMTNFEGFRDIVDVLGGVTIDVERRMYYRDPLASPPLVIDLQPGEQRLDGDKALQYVRYRGYDKGDITRTQAQQKFLTALASEMMKARNVLKLPRLIPKINDCVDTNLGLTDMLRWANFARKLGEVEMISATLPGNFMDYDGLSYWYVDPVRAKEVAVKLLNGEEIGDPVDRRLTPPVGVAYQSSPPQAQAPANNEPESERSAPPPGDSLEPPSDGLDDDDAEEEPAPGEPVTEPEEPSDDPLEPPAWPIVPEADR